MPLVGAAVGRLAGGHESVASRAYSLAYNEELSVGRVQTPTLAMLVERELAIRAFVPEDYLEVVATFHPQGKPVAETYRGTWFRERAGKGADKETLAKSMRLTPDGEEAAGLRRGRARARRPSSPWSRRRIAWRRCRCTI